MRKLWAAKGTERREADRRRDASPKKASEGRSLKGTTQGNARRANSRTGEEDKMQDAGVLKGMKARKLVRIGVVLAILLSSSAVGLSLSSAAPDPCQDVWKGATPGDPLGKVADPTSAHPGDSVTYTFTWHSTGAANAGIEDCY